MYWYRHRADEVTGRPYLSIGAGWRDAVRRRIVTYGVEDWREEIPWMTLYFSTGVWVSLSLVRAPRFTPEPRPSELAAQVVEHVDAGDEAEEALAVDTRSPPCPARRWAAATRRGVVACTVVEPRGS